MIIKVTELCWVDYIKEDIMEKENNEKLTATRTVIYESVQNTLLDAFQDYDKNFNINNVLQSNDDFDGQCLDTLKYIAVEEIENY